MAEWDDQAIILRLGQFRESDIWLKALFQHHGLQTVFAFGGARSHRRFCGCLDTLNLLNCRVRESKGGAYFCMQEAELLSGVRNLRSDWQLAGLAANCMRFVEAMTIDADSAPDAYAVLADLRLHLEDSRLAQAWLPFFFRLRIASGLGFAPNFDTCETCGAPLHGGLFSPAAGRTYCRECAGKPVRAAAHALLPASSAALAWLRHVQRSLPRQWGRTDVTTRDERDCMRIADAFVQYHLGYAWDNGGFRRGF